jgi:WD40 repeat protein
LAFSAALQAAPKGAAAKKISYDEHVLPILKDKCLACHNQDKAKGGLRMHTFTNLMTGSSSGEIVKPGDPESSTLYQVVTHKQEPFMPPESPMLAKERLEIIRQWIAGGALENAGSKAIAAKPKVDVGLTSIVKGKPAGPPPMPAGKLRLEPVVKTARASALTALAASPWAPLLAVAGQKQVLLYHSDSLELLGILPFLEGIPHVLKFSRNGSLLLAGGGRGGKSGSVVLWSVKTGQRILTVGAESDCVLAADISADQSQIALGGPSKMIRVYSTKDGKLLREIKKHTDWVTALEYSPDGVLLATGDRNGGLFVWEAFTGREYFSLRGHTKAITGLSWRNDANVLASASEDTTVRLWEMENGNQIKSWGAHGEGVQSLQFSRDGLIVSCGRDRLTRTWDQNGSQKWVFAAFADVALRATFSHDAGRVVAGDWTGELRVWNSADGKLVGKLVSNPPPVKERLLAASKDLAAAETAHKSLAAKASAAQTASQKAAADVAAAKKAAADKAASAKNAPAAVPPAKIAADKANADLVTVQKEVAAKALQAKALADKAVQSKVAADKAKTNQALNAAALKDQTAATQAAAELTALQIKAATLTATAKAANDRLAAAQRAVTATQAAATAAAKQVEFLTAVAKALAATAEKAKVEADLANAAVAAARARVERLKGALGVVKKSGK